MHFVGIDPGLVSTGYAVIKSERGRGVLVSSGVLSPPKNLPLEERIFFLYQGIKKVILESDVQEVSIEDIFFAKSTPTILSMAQARGALLAGVMSAGARVTSYTPTQIKQAVTGSGRATKDQIAHMVGVFLALDTASFSEHATDAMAIALCHSLLRS